MGDQLYILNNKKASIADKSPYETEDQLQEIIANNPNLLLRDIDGEYSELYLISREQNVDELSLDILLVDQDGVLTLVEVKRSADTRIRREVVGQMLDYASLVNSWDISTLRDDFEKNNPYLTWSEEQSSEFWQNVENSMKLEKLKLVFAADKIPMSLKNIIKFLGRHFSNIEVYGVEIRRYSAGDSVLLSTSFVQSNHPVQETKTRIKAFWDTDSIFDFLKFNNCEYAIAPLTKLLDFCYSNGCRIEFGHGPSFASIIARMHEKKILTIWVGPYSGGFKCILEIEIIRLAGFLSSDEWNEQSIRELLSDLPCQDEFHVSDMLWNTPNTLYINIKLLTKNENLSCFLESLSRLNNAMREKTKEL